MLSADAMVIQVEADRIVQLAKQQAEHYFGDINQKEGNVVLANLYSKANSMSQKIITQADELHTCLILIEEMEKE